MTPGPAPGRPAGGGARPPAGRTQVVAGLAVIAALAVVAWLLVGALYAALHVIELIAVAAVAGWTGYRVGRYRGRRQG